MEDDRVKQSFEGFIEQVKEIAERGGLDLDALPEPVQKPVVNLIGEDGNAFAILGKVTQALKSWYGPGLGNSIADEYQRRAMSGDYNHLLNVTMEYVDVI